MNTRAGIWGAALVLLLAKIAAAQQTLPSAALQATLPSAPLQMNLPSASLPPETAVATPRSDLHGAGPGTYAPRFDRLLHPDPRLFPCCAGSFAPFLAVTPSWAADSHSRRAPQERRFGYLQLLVEPETAHVYIDGFYKGTVNDIRRLVPVEAGARRVELRASGYQSVSFDVRIVADETIAYQRKLEPSPALETPAAPRRGVPKTFYVIPNCYAGDKPPVRDALPKSCDMAKLRTIPPVVSSVR